MKKTITYKRLQGFDLMATNYLIKNDFFTPAEKNENGQVTKAGFFTNKAETRLVKNIKNIIKQANVHFDKYKEEIGDIYDNLCLEDPKTKALLYNANGSHQLDREGTKKAKEQVKALSEKEIEINIRITDGDFDDLTSEEKEAFNGIVIPEFKTEEELE